MPIRPKLFFLHLKNTPILEQLRIEEMLLRTDTRSFCLVNFGSPRAIVMGISGKMEELLDTPRVKKEKIPVIKRFSGGGTVIVDENTLFISFLMAKDLLKIHAFPEPILKWSFDLYRAAWNIEGFHLKENDYCIRDRKCGGNAQYIRKERWIHHTSFLWDYKETNMDFLLLPKKRPLYRKERSHEEFLCRLQSHGKDPETRIQELKEELSKHFSLQDFDLKELTEKPHRKATELITHPER